MNKQEFLDIIKDIREKNPDMSPAAIMEAVQIVANKKDEVEKSFPEIPYDWDELSKL